MTRKLCKGYLANREHSSMQGLRLGFWVPPFPPDEGIQQG